VINSNIFYPSTCPQGPSPQADHQKGFFGLISSNKLHLQRLPSIQAATFPSLSFPALLPQAAPGSGTAQHIPVGCLKAFTSPTSESCSVSPHPWATVKA